MVEAFTYIGLITTLILCIFIPIQLIKFICDRISKLINRRKLRNQLDQPINADCYCIDCIYHNNDTGKCYRLESKYTADNWFCWDAEPKKHQF